MFNQNNELEQFRKTPEFAQAMERMASETAQKRQEAFSELTRLEKVLTNVTQLVKMQIAQAEGAVRAAEDQLKEAQTALSKIQIEGRQKIAGLERQADGARAFLRQHLPAAVTELIQRRDELFKLAQNQGSPVLPELAALHDQIHRLHLLNDPSRELAALNAALDKIELQAGRGPAINRGVAARGN